ncbi:IS110 family transposase [Allorhodopirellula heiligendammensis]|uniref:Transposase IS116/IS110/IS902 family protein n=1 Tax=Allorhodopirellula heiligendammensis TaxID=2714739 RepID=A0A5C6C6N2_9BACT|nr:IS110 family transposase [Allorhodopirellula heiligendammensis]TWU19732.1 Transposase IS116/IS110/IS902 family protein [Allorhodopirellula heiligendammensis]
MKILALDLGKFNSVCCLFDSKTRKTQFVSTPTTREHFGVIFQDTKADLVVMEACGPSGWINDLAQHHGHETLVCSTNEEAWRWANVKRKTDRDDALKLARMAAMGELKGVHTPTLEHREFRSLVKYRKTLDGRINKTKNAIRAWFVNHGIEIATGEKAWHSGREHINSFRKPLTDCGPEELWKGELDIELTILDSLAEQLTGVVKKLEAIGKNDERIKRVQTIPGVGPRTAEILVACLDDPHRFENGRQVSAYFGLVPRQYQSGETDRNGRITKRGNPLARTILVECAWASLRYNPWAKGVYERICGKQKTRKKKAASALARKIAVIAWAMLRDEKDWDPKQMIQVTESFGRMPAGLKDSLQNMKPKENADQRKSRLRKEARAAREAAERGASKTTGQNPVKRTSTGSAKPTASKRKATNSPATRSPRSTSQSNEKLRTKTSKPRRARKPVISA